MRIRRQRLRKPTIKGYKRECNRLWVEAIRKKFNYKCGICGSQKCINAHHVFSKKGHPSTRYDIDNGVLLCFRCHLGAHNADPEIILKILSHFETTEYEKLRTKAKSGNCKHDYEAIIEELKSI